MLGIQLVGILFGLFMLYITFIFSKKKEFTSREWVIWSGLWVLFMILAIFPQLLDPVMVGLALARKMDFFISLGFMLFTVIIFYTYIIVRTNQKKIETLIRDITFLNEQLEKKEVKKDGSHKD